MTTIPSVTLQTAVLLAVKNFAGAGRKFSIHDITKAIRQQCNTGELEIPEVESPGGQNHYDIQHPKIKSLFLELRDTGVFDPDFSLAENFNGTFREYTPVPLNTQPPITTPTTLPVTSVSTTPSKVVWVSHSIDSNVAHRVDSYLNNCSNRGFRPTLRQVQSAIKRGDKSTGYTVDELRDYIKGGLGYKLAENPNSIAKYQVVV